MATLAKSIGKRGGARAGTGSSTAGAIVIGFGAGLAVALGRKIAVQAVSGLSGNWLAAIKTEHKLALAIFDKILDTPNDATTKRALLLTTLKHALGKHAFQEENVIYPALRDAAKAEQADHLNHDHGYIKTYLYDLERIPKSEPAWLDKVRELRQLVADHAREEEEEIFPPFEQAMSPDENSKLTLLMNKEGFKLA
ncbi:MAG: hemerythrin domain-containing protein [Janthinobacterium lividum]